MPYERQRKVRLVPKTEGREIRLVSSLLGWTVERTALAGAHVMSADVRDDAATVRAVILACQPIGQKRFLDVLERLEAAAARTETLEAALLEIGYAKPENWRWMWMRERARRALAGENAETPR